MATEANPTTTKYGSWTRAQWEAADPDSPPADWDSPSGVTWKQRVMNGRKSTRSANAQNAQRRIDWKTERRQRQAREVETDLRVAAEVDAEVAEIYEQERREEAAKLRQDAAYVGVNLQHRGQAPKVVVREGHVYDAGNSPRDNMGDFLALQVMRQGAVPPLRGGDLGFDETFRRQLRHRKDMQAMATKGTAEQRAFFRSYFIEESRPSHGQPSDASNLAWRALAFDDIEARRRAFEESVPETRASTTTTMAFTPNFYDLQETAQWITAAAPVMAQSKQQPLGPNGMVVDVPQLTSGVAISAQNGEGTAVSSSSPTSTYGSGNVLTLAGTVQISQQSVSRSAISIQGVLAESAAREMGTQGDIAALQALLAGCQNVVNNNSPGIQELWSDVSYAAQLIENVEGTRLSPTHTLMSSSLTRYFQSQLGSDGRPVWLPTAGNSAAVGELGTAQEGFTGYGLLGTGAWRDDNFSSASASFHGVVVADLPHGLLALSGPPVVKLFPEYAPATLTCIVQFIQYVCFVPLFPKSAVAIQGSAYPASPSWLDA